MCTAFLRCNKEAAKSAELYRKELRGVTDWLTIKSKFASHCTDFAVSLNAVTKLLQIEATKMFAEHIFGAFLMALSIGAPIADYPAEGISRHTPMIQPAVVRESDFGAKLEKAADLGCPLYGYNGYRRYRGGYDDCYYRRYSYDYYGKRRGYYEPYYDRRYGNGYYPDKDHYADEDDDRSPDKDDDFSYDNDYRGPRYGDPDDKGYDRYGKGRRDDYDDHDDDGDYSRKRSYRGKDYYPGRHRSFYHPSSYDDDGDEERACGLLCWLNRLASEDLPLSGAYYRPDCGYDCERRHMRYYCERHSWRDPSGCWHCPTGCHGIYRPCRNWRCHF